MFAVWLISQIMQSRLWSLCSRVGWNMVINWKRSSRRRLKTGWGSFRLQLQKTVYGAGQRAQQRNAKLLYYNSKVSSRWNRLRFKTLLLKDMWKEEQRKSEKVCSRWKTSCSILSEIRCLAVPSAPKPVGPKTLQLSGDVWPKVVHETSGVKKKNH